MNLGFRLAPEHRAELDAIQAEHRANPPLDRVQWKPHKYARHVMPTGGMLVANEALKTSPLAKSDRGFDPITSMRGVKRDLAPFRAMIGAKYKPGARVPVAVAAELWGVSRTVACRWITRLKGMRDWPFLPARPGNQFSKTRGDAK